MELIMPENIAANTILHSTSHQHKSVVMVVDDDFSARMQLRLALENTGHEIVEAGSGREALEILKNHLRILSCSMSLCLNWMAHWHLPNAARFTGRCSHTGGNGHRHGRYRDHHPGF